MTDTQNEMAAIVADQAERLFAGAVSRERLEAADGGPFDTQLWTEVQQMGLPLALLAETEGGIGLAPGQAFGLARRAAAHALPLPLGETMIVAALTGTPAEAPATLALAKDDGALPSVAWGGDAAQVLVADAQGWQLVDAADVSTSERRNLAGEPRCDLKRVAEQGRSVAVPDWLSADTDSPVEALRAVGALLRSVQISGALGRAVELAVRHATERQQFGRPLSKFQAIQHMLAVATEESAAVWAISDAAAEGWGRPGFVLRAAMAKSRAGLATGRVAAIVHQIHAAMGFTREHELHFTTRRLFSWREEFGSDALWDEWIGRRVCAAGGAALWPQLVASTTAHATGEDAA